MYFAFQSNSLSPAWASTLATPLSCQRHTSLEPEQEVGAGLSSCPYMRGMSQIVRFPGQIHVFNRTVSIFRNRRTKSDGAGGPVRTGGRYVMSGIKSKPGFACALSRDV